MTTTTTAGTDRFTGWALIAVPFVALVAAIVISAAETAETEIDIFTSPAWTIGFFILAIAIALFGLGFSHAAPKLGLGGSWLSGTALTIVPVGFLLWLVTAYNASGIIEEGHPQIAQPDLLDAALKLTEVTANGLFLLVGALIGVVTAGASWSVLNGATGLSRRAAITGLVLGVVALGANLVLLLTTNNTAGVWELGPYSTQLALFWAIPVGRRLAKGA